MRRLAKTSRTRTALRKVTGNLLASPTPCAWIDASDSGVSFSAAAGIVTARVRDGLVLRLVAQRHPRRVSHAAGAH